MRHTDWMRWDEAWNAGLNWCGVYGDLLGNIVFGVVVLWWFCGVFVVIRVVKM